MPDLDLFAEANRQLTVCNACRYCEGYCPVFPALESRRIVTDRDVVYLAHLCHDCRACYRACMYSPPHEFAVNIPKILADVRLENYQRWSWPSILARGFTESRVGIILVTSSVSVVAILAVLLVRPSVMFSSHRGSGSFYDVIPYLVMIACAIGLCCYSTAVWLVGGGRFWRETTGSLREHRRLEALARAIADILNLRGLKGGGPGCYYPEAKPSSNRRIYHSLVFYGFMFDLFSTTIAGIYQNFLHQMPPYPLASAPVVLGTLGGVALVVGVSGLIILKVKSDRAPASSRNIGLDYMFLASVGLTALTGLLTLAFRTTRGMGSMLTLHLGFVAALFISAPYGKFVHAMYRSLALLRSRVEQVQRTRTAVH
jgi:citrate/tricarballylate utilization protein